MTQSKTTHRICRTIIWSMAALVLGSAVRLEVAQAQVANHQAPATARKAAPITDLASAVRQTAAVVEGVVSDIRYDYSDEAGPWTRVILSDVYAHFGSVPETVEIRHFGGPLPNGRLMIAAELPVFVRGGRYVVFLRNTAWNVSPVVGDLALRVETLGDAEVLVKSDGQAVTAVGPRGVEVGAALFASPELDGTAPKALYESVSALARAPLDRWSFVEALGATLAEEGLAVEGAFYDRPAGEFTWRAQRTAPPVRAAAPASTAAARDGGPELDTSNPNQ